MPCSKTQNRASSIRPRTPRTRPGSSTRSCLSLHAHGPAREPSCRHGDDGGHAARAFGGDAIRVEHVRVRHGAQTTDIYVIRRHTGGDQLVAIRSPEIEVWLWSAANEPSTDA